MGSQPTDYAIEMSESELQRLLTIADIGANVVRGAVFVAGVRQGSKVIDVGCGALGALRELAEMVGPQGVVVGVDLSAEALNRARHVLGRLDLGWVQLRQIDVNAESAPSVLSPPGPFDFAFCRLFLMHQSDPVATLKSVGRLVRPGGMIVVQEPAFGHPEGAEVLEAAQHGSDMFFEVVAARGGNPTVGRHMHDLAESAGMELVWQTLFGSYRSGAASLAFVAATLRSTKRAILESGRHSEAEVDRTIAAIEEAVKDERWQRPHAGQVGVSALIRVPV